MKPKVGVCLCILKDNKVLLHKRISKHANGYFGFPGGHLEMFESFEEAALRELKEEAGNIEVTKPKYLTTYNTFFPEENKHYVVIIMVAHYIKGRATVVEPHKCEFWKWYDWNNLPKPLMPGIVEMNQNFSLDNLKNF